MKKYWFGLIGTVLLGVYSYLYAAIFFAWLPATPLTQDQLSISQNRATTWF
jgi:hypothetical protein